MPPAKKIAVISKECVACGTCVKSCPKQALSVYKGTTAVVSAELCVGCGKCAKICPADVIMIRGRDEIEKKMV